MAGIRKEAQAKARAAGHGTTTRSAGTATQGTATVAAGRGMTTRSAGTARQGTAAGRASAQAATATRTTAKTAALPGESAVRPELVDAAVREINRIYVGKGIEAVRAIGECVLKTFFGGRTENFERRAKEHLSFRKLAERDDLRVSHSHLWKCVAVVGQLRVLPADVANSLPVTHQKLLLPLADEKTKVSLARRAVRENLATRQLAEAVRLVREKDQTGAKRGRPPLPPLVRILSRLGTVAQQLRTTDGEDAAIGRLAPDKVKAILDRAEENVQLFRRLIARMRGDEGADAAAMGRAAL